MILIYNTKLANVSGYIYSDKIEEEGAKVGISRESRPRQEDRFTVHFVDRL